MEDISERKIVNTKTKQFYVKRKTGMIFDNNTVFIFTHISKGKFTIIYNETILTTI